MTTHVIPFIYILLTGIWGYWTKAYVHQSNKWPEKYPE